MFRDAAESYTQSKLQPRIVEANRHELFDRDILYEMGENGMLGRLGFGVVCAYPSPTPSHLRATPACPTLHTEETSAQVSASAAWA